MRKLALLFLLPTAVQAETILKIGDETYKIDVQSIHAEVHRACERVFCDAGDTDCDGVLDDYCPGLTYDVCEQGSIVASYIQAAFTGFCYSQEPEVDGDECNFDGLSVSPGGCGS